MAVSPPSDTAVAEFAGQLFFRLWRASHTRIADGLETIGLTPATFGLLNVLGARGGATQRELGSAMGVGTNSVGVGWASVAWGSSLADGSADVPGSSHAAVVSSVNTQSTSDIASWS